MNDSVMDPLRQRFEQRTERGSGCWGWSGLTAPNGYAIMPRRTGTPYAHRISYELHHGPIPTGMQVDHQCHTRSCTNPAHLQLVSIKRNAENRAGVQSNSTTGIRGVFITPRGRYRVQVTHERRAYGGGVFDDPKEAEHAAIALRNELFTNNLLDRKAS